MRRLRGKQGCRSFSRPRRRGHRRYLRFRWPANHCVARSNQWRVGLRISSVDEHDRVSSGAGLSAASECRRKLVKIWKTLLLVYRELDVRLSLARDLVGRDSVEPRTHFHHVVSERELADAIDSFRGFPQLVRELTSGKATIEYEIVRPDRAITSLTHESSSHFWPSPDDIRSDLDEFASPGKYDSIFVFWPQRNLKNGMAVPWDAWGEAVGASDGETGRSKVAISKSSSLTWIKE